MSPTRIHIPLAAILGMAFAASATAASKPNIIVILADDLGWSDVGFNGCGEIPTPNLDALAKSGVVFTSGYVPHPYCSPSRAGLMTGRYQQRFGHECNPEQNETDGTPLTETFLPQALKPAGYHTGMIGKWHLGDDRKFWPSQRGFDDWFGFSSGGRSYWGHQALSDSGDVLLRNDQPVAVENLGHLTDEFSREAVEFIERNQQQPFFLYLAYNAPHAPDQATAEHLKRTEHIEYGGRAVYGAMVSAMDAGIGQVMRKLDELKLRDNTLVVFFSDNGGRAELAVNFPYRGHKGMLFEGGIRVPFLISWPARITADRKVDEPVNGLDVFPTALAAAGVSAPADLALDGANLLPALTEHDSRFPNRDFFWRYACGDGVYGRAIRSGDYKWVKTSTGGRTLLFDLHSDPYEIHDIATDHPDIVAKLSETYASWEKSMIAPHWFDPHGANVLKEESARKVAVDAASRGEKPTPDR